MLDVDHAPAAAHRRAVPGTASAGHPPRVKPELLATAPGDVWSWEITKLRGPERGVYYDLYVVIDIFSRYVVGWTVAAREDAQIARALPTKAMQVHGAPGSVHADRGTSMTSKPVAQLLVDLGVARSHSRPHVSNDNPFSEAQFKTLNYVPAFPDRFGSLADARAFCETFFAYDNHEHRHSGLGLHTRPRCTTAPPPRSAPGERPLCRRPTPPTQPASATGAPHPRRCRPPPGSTSPAERPSSRTPDAILSQPA